MPPNNAWKSRRSFWTGVSHHSKFPLQESMYSMRLERSPLEKRLAIIWKNGYVVPLAIGMERQVNVVQCIVQTRFCCFHSIPSPDFAWCDVTRSIQMCFTFSVRRGLGFVPASVFEAKMSSVSGSHHVQLSRSFAILPKSDRHFQRVSGE